MISAFVRWLGQVLCRQMRPQVVGGGESVLTAAALELVAGEMLDMGSHVFGSNDADEFSSLDRRFFSEQTDREQQEQHASRRR